MGMMWGKVVQSGERLNPMDSIGQLMDKGVYDFRKGKGRKGVSLIHAP